MPSCTPLTPVDEEKLSEWTLVLEATGFEYRVSEEEGPWIIEVPSSQYEEAMKEIDEYEEDCRTWNQPLPLSFRSWPKPGGTWSPLWVAAMLISFYVWAGPYEEGSAQARSAAMNTDRFFAGEWWRAVTALTVHADAGHLLGNLVSIVLFGYAVCWIFGPGLGWLLILASGILGNLFATGLYGAGHISVGASTACFGALGLLSGCQAIRNFQEHGFSASIWNRVWIPVGAGLAMLALLGTGMQSDVLAHFFGLLSGMALCLPFAFLRPPSLPPVWCRALQILTLLILMIAWRLAVTEGIAGHHAVP